MVQSPEDPGQFELFTSEEATAAIGSTITATALVDPHFNLIGNDGFSHKYPDGTETERSTITQAAFLRKTVFG